MTPTEHARLVRWATRADTAIAAAERALLASTGALAPQALPDAVDLASTLVDVALRRQGAELRDRLADHVALLRDLHAAAERGWWATVVALYAAMAALRVLEGGAP